MVFYIFFLCIIALAIDMGSTQINESSNLSNPSIVTPTRNTVSSQINESSNRNNQCDKPIDTIVPIICTVIGVIIGGLLTYFTTLKEAEKQARISYISAILGQQSIAEKLSYLLEKIEKVKRFDHSQDIQQELINKINNEVRETWFFLLFTPSQKCYNELKYHIENKQWNESINTISKFLRGEW